MNKFVDTEQRRLRARFHPLAGVIAGTAAALFPAMLPTRLPLASLLSSD